MAVTDTTHDNKGKEDMCGMFGLCREQVDPRFREPFIVNGYRKPNMGAMDCVKSTMVYYCNETINVWSHFLAFLYFLHKFIHIFTQEHSLIDPYHWPFVTYLVGIQGFCLMSSLAHTFNSISPLARNVCFSLDYAAISIYSVGAGQAFFFYSRPIDPALGALSNPHIYSVISVAISLGSTVKCCLTRQKWHSLKYLLRTMSYVMPFVWNTCPYLYRMVTSAKGMDDTSTTSMLFYIHAVLYIVAACVNVSRIPERCIPGVFCALGQSHHWMHVLTAIGAGIQLEGVKMEMEERRSALEKQSNQWNCSYSLLFMMVAIVSNFVVASCFGVTTPTDRYAKAGQNSKTNSEELKKHD